MRLTVLCLNTIAASGEIQGIRPVLSKLMFYRTRLASNLKGLLLDMQLSRP